MFYEIKYSDQEAIEEFIKFSNLFLKEYFSEQKNNNIISTLSVFNNVKTVSEEIKEKRYSHYLIKNKEENIGILTFNIHQNDLEIIQIYIIKKYRKQKISYEIIEKLKEIARKNNCKNIKTSIIENNKKLEYKIINLGFQKIENIAKYIGNNIYLYENIYQLRVHIE